MHETIIQNPIQIVIFGSTNHVSRYKRELHKILSLHPEMPIGSWEIRTTDDPGYLKFSAIVIANDRLAPRTVNDLARNGQVLCEASATSPSDGSVAAIADAFKAK